MQWFRMWAEAVDDEKLKLLAFEDRWHFVAILCCKRKGILDAEDSPALRDRKIGAKLGLADRDRDEVKRRLMEVNLIDEDWQPLAWNKRQFVSDADPTAKQRKQKQRDKQRHARVTRDDRDSHTPVTGESLEGHTPQTQIQTTDSEKKPPSEACVALTRDGPVRQVFEHWQSTWGHAGARLDAKRRKRIEARLANFTPAQLCDAVSGFRNSPWHRGTDPKGSGTVYDGIDTLLRDDAQVETGLRLLANPPRAPPKQSETAMDRILRANSGPDDSTVIEHEPELRALTG